MGVNDIAEPNLNQLEFTTDSLTVEELISYKHIIATRLIILKKLPSHQKIC